MSAIGFHLMMCSIICLIHHLYNIHIDRTEDGLCCAGCLLLSPVRLVNSGSTFEARSLDDYFKRGDETSQSCFVLFN